jgi:hypothetical protein
MFGSDLEQKEINLMPESAQQRLDEADKSMFTLHGPVRF